LSAAGVLLAVYFLFVLDGQGVDAYAYWRVGHDDPYSIASAFGAFHYPPPALLPIYLLAWLPWPAFYWVLSAASVAALAWMGGRWSLALLAFPPVSFELFHGNIHLLLAAAIVAGMRWPAALGVPLLTKVTPGIVALLWFVPRRSWRSVAIALGATVALVLATAWAWPGLWAEWFRHLEVAGGLPGPDYLRAPLPLRLAIAAAIALWGGWTGRRWTVIVAATVALPILWLNGLAMLVGVVPLVRADRRGSSRP
jgi:hypothetical protein